MVSIGISYIKRILAGIEHSGADIEKILSQANIPAEIFRQQDARLDEDQVTELFRAAWRLTGDEFFGFFNQPSKLGASALMSRYLAGGDNLGDALRESLRAFSLIRNDIECGIEVDGELCRLKIEADVVDGLESNTFSCFLLMLWHRQSCWLIGERIKLLSAAFKAEYSKDFNEDRVLLPCDINYGQKDCYIEFPSRYLNRKLIRSEAEILAYFQDLPRSMLVLPGEDHSYSSKVKRFMLQRQRERLPLADIDTVAKALGMSKQSLHRYLTREGTNFQRLKDSVRRDAAMDKLANTAVPISTIAIQLGFSEPSAFTRAFKRWTGVAPVLYREQNQLSH